MRNLLIVMLVALAITGCKKSEEKQASQSSVTAPSAANSGPSYNASTMTNKTQTPEEVRKNTVAVPPVAPGVSPPQREPIITQTVFNCSNNSRFTAQFTASGVNVIFDSHKPIYMKKKVVASGFQYSTPHYVLRGKGRKAEWTTLGRKPFECTAR